MVYTVYEATFERHGSSALFHYAGMTSRNLQGRGAAHVELPVDWGRRMKVPTLHLRAHMTCKIKITALAEEARLAAKLVRRDEQHARGGPWSQARIMPGHRKQMDIVLACSSAAEVIRQAVPGMALWKHLHDEPYADNSQGWMPKKTTRKTRKKKLSGSERRRRDGLTYGTAAYDEAKYGCTPARTQANIQSRYNSGRPGRKRGVKRNH